MWVARLVRYHTTNWINSFKKAHGFIHILSLFLIYSYEMKLKSQDFLYSLKFDGEGRISVDKFLCTCSPCLNTETQRQHCMLAWRADTSHALSSHLDVLQNVLHRCVLLSPSIQQRKTNELISSKSNGKDINFHTLLRAFCCLDLCIVKSWSAINIL